MVDRVRGGVLQVSPAKHPHIFSPLCEIPISLHFVWREGGRKMDFGILILVAIGSICLGFLVGFILRGITNRSSEKNKVVEPTSELLSASEAERKPAPKKAPNRNAIEVANLWRDNRNGRLIFQIEDQFYKRGDDLTTNERELLLKIVMDFYRWLEPPSAVGSKQNEEDQSAWQTDNLPIASDQQDLPPEIDLEISEEETKTVRGGLNPVNFISRALRSDVVAPLPPSQSMVAQVDKILQEKLRAADMQKWAVRLTEFPGKGMVVLVGLDQYSNIDDVPYERVRKVIREFVAEWERRAENGKMAQ